MDFNNDQIGKEFTENLTGEHWEFTAHDTLNLKREGLQSIIWFCSEEKVEGMTTDSFSVLKFKSNWTIKGEFMVIELIYNGSLEVYDYRIEALSDKVLKLQTLDKNISLTFSRTK